MLVNFQKINTSEILNAGSIHFIGIGGIGISAVARMMKEMGKNVTGQDMQDGEIISELKKIGISITIGQSYENIPLDTDLIIYTIAIEYYDKDLYNKVKNGKIISKSYPEMLGLISKDKYTIAVCGTHGKTTTTGMISEVLIGANKNPTVIVGSLLKGRTNFIKGESDLFIAEACEYRRSFLNINPNILVITNIDEDHLDYYRDIEDIKDAFREMVLKVPDDGFIVCNPNDKNISDVIKNIKAKVIDWEKFFDINLKLKIPGIHNKKDAACAIAVSSVFNISREKASMYLQEFPGTWKRFEFKGKTKNGVLIYDDYAHHPTEVKATLSGFREIYKKEDAFKIITIFQPHLFSRTKLLLDDFAKSFYDADEVWLLPIYYAREIDDGSISSDILCKEINKITNNAFVFDDFLSLENKLKDHVNTLDEKTIIITMGAGNAFQIGESILN